MSAEKKRVQTVVGKRIQDLRQARDMSQHDLSVASGVDKVTIWRIESGETQSPSIDNIIALAKGLRVPVSEITGTEQYDDPRYTPQQQAMLEAVPPKATAAFADFTRGLFSMPEDEWRAFISYNVTHFARIKGLQITERAESKDVTVLGNDPPASEEEEQDLQEA